MSNPTELPDLYTVISFLLGEGALDGSYFGDSDTKKPRKRYWWREHLRAARRAQPEGEAPQAKPVAWMVPIQGLYEYFATEQAARKEREAYEQEMSDDPDLEHVAPVPLYEHAASLSPLCGAQHAESGKERGSIEDYNEFNRLLGNWGQSSWGGSADEIDSTKAYGDLVEYIDAWAYPRAAQLDGGQEGSESNG